MAALEARITQLAVKKGHEMKPWDAFEPETGTTDNEWKEIFGHE